MKKASTLKNKFRSKLSSLHNNSTCQAASSNGGQTSSSCADQQQPSGRSRRHYFNEALRTYSCIHCRAQLASHDELVSKLFQGNQGRAYLFNKVVNVNCRQAVRRQLLTGPHEVADIYCANCHTTLGWKYEQAFVASQKYKEGKYIIELCHMLKGNEWDITFYNSQLVLGHFEQQSARKFAPSDFTIGSNYFGSIDLLEASVNKQLDNMKTSIKRDDATDLQETTPQDDEEAANSTDVVVAAETRHSTKIDINPISENNNNLIINNVISSTNDNNNNNNESRPYTNGANHRESPELCVDQHHLHHIKAPSLQPKPDTIELDKLLGV